MAFAGMCPYLKNTKKSDGAVCECATFRFPDKQARRDVLYGYCGHPDAWRGCMFKVVMDSYYERKFASEAVPPAKEKKTRVNKLASDCCAKS
ncbi:MAG: hypothetical protein IJW65_01630 [Clostridia bacterium]|nr:hypothetical protein [Clostridia bacterium]